MGKGEKFKSFFKKAREKIDKICDFLLTLFIFVGISFICISIILRWFTSYGSILGVLYIAICIVFICLLLILFDIKVREWVKKESILTNIFLILFALLTTILAYYIDKNYQFVKERDENNKIHDVLAVTTDMNFQHADELTQDVKNEWIYWRNFYLLPYNENFGWILNNYSKECALLYINVIRDMEVANAINNTITINTAWDYPSNNPIEVIGEFTLFNKYKKELKERSENIKNSLKNVLEKCYGRQFEKDDETIATSSPIEN